MYARRVDSSALVFSLSSHRHSFIYRFCLQLSLYRFIINSLSETWTCSKLDPNPSSAVEALPAAAGLKSSDVASLSDEDQDNMDVHEENM